MTEWKPEPQTPEQVEQGLKDAMKQAKENGVFDWKREKNISSPWDVDVWENNIGQPVKPSGANLPYPYTLNLPKQSNWTCYLFGAAPGYGLAYNPQEGKVPNRFVRFMSRIFFACTWVEKK